MTKFIRIGIETFASKKSTGEIRFYDNDHLGGVNVITDGNGARCQLNEYDPWGSVSKQDGNCDPTHKFTGKELDPETGLYYYGGRYYDPEISRFISADPFVQDPDEPQNFNRYSYVDNNPINYIDPSGYFYMSKSGGGGSIFGTIFGAIVGFFFGGPVGAVIGAGIGTGLAHISPTVLHAMEIFGGIAMLLAGQPAGFFFLAQGSLGLCENTGCQISSAVMGLAGGLTSFSGGPSGTSGSGPSGASSFGFGASGISGIEGGGNLGGFGGIALVNAAITAQGAIRRVGDDQNGGPNLHARWWQFFRTPRPPVGQPKPPGWTPEWQWRYPEHNIGGKPRYFDPNHGEWRWHAPDKYHPQGHWDYNPWDQWNSPWRNVPPTRGPVPSMPPIGPTYPLPDLLPDPWA
jgi:RHS repeat-associated protein